jgi:hypothetical protein
MPMWTPLGGSESVSDRKWLSDIEKSEQAIGNLLRSLRSMNVCTCGAQW